MATDKILEVKKLFKDGSEYIVDCPHCGKFVGVDGELEELKGEMFHHNGTFGCDGWFEVSSGAVRVNSINDLVSD